MKSILPRLKKVLGILLDEPAPVPVKEVATRLRVSRRTVFRELSGADSVLKHYGLEIGSRPGEGLVLEGPEEGRQRLEKQLAEADRGDPGDKNERRQRLLFELIRNPGKKLFAYGERLGVSVATVSNDLDILEPGLNDCRLALKRGAGTGIHLDGEEYHLRRAVIGLLQERSREGLPQLEPAIADILHDWENELRKSSIDLGWMTPQSRLAITNYIAVMVWRCMGGDTLGEFPLHSPRGLDLARQFARLIEECFDLACGDAEMHALALELSAAQRTVEPGPQELEESAAFDRLALQLIMRFDPELAASLQLDEALVSGLAAHLASAVVRIQNHIELPDPMLRQMTELYPEIMVKCRRAAEALNHYGAWLPDDEVSFLAAHFGAAVLRLSERQPESRRAHIGVVCVFGIGTSYLLASQVRKRFGRRVETEVGWQEDRDGWSRFDFLIATTEIPGANLPVIVVNPILTDADAEQIAVQLAAVGERLESAPGGAGDVEVCFSALANMAHDASALIRDLTVTAVADEMDMDGLIVAAAHRYGGTDMGKKKLHHALAERERISSQIIPELGVVLLHCRSEAVGAPVFSLFRPEGGRFAAIGDGECRACLVMLVPAEGDKLRLEMMGALSGALVQDASFLDAVRTGDENHVRAHVEHILKCHVLRYATRNLEE